MAAAGKHEWDALVAQLGCNRPNTLALQVDVEDGEIESALIDFFQRLADEIAGSAELCPIDSRKSSSIIAINGSSSTIKMERPSPMARK